MTVKLAFIAALTLAAVAGLGAGLWLRSEQVADAQGAASLYKTCLETGGDSPRCPKMSAAAPYSVSPPNKATAIPDKLPDCPSASAVCQIGGNMDLTGAKVKGGPPNAPVIYSYGGNTKAPGLQAERPTVDPKTP